MMNKITQLFKVFALLAALFIALPGMAMLPPAEEIKSDEKAVNQEDAREMFKAAAEGDLDKVREFIEKKGVPLAAYELHLGYSALHYAADGGHYNVVKYLVGTKQMDVNVEDLYLTTPLHYAAQGGSDWREKDRDTHYNEEQKYLNVVQYLVEHGARMDTEDDVSRTALSYAVEAGYRKIAAYLIEQSRVDLKNPTSKNEETLLLYAVLSGNYMMMEDIVCENVDVNRANDDGQTALMLAAQEGNEEMVKYFVEHTQVYLSAKDGEGRTAIMYAEENGHEAIAQYLREELARRTEN